tara:strand:+ start:1437 stop:1949 length:513 start_codon:yes stop_codon:yes gene_type:complete
MIHICAWRAVDAHAESIAATHVVSLLGVEGRPETPARIAPGCHLDLDVDDIAAAAPGYVLPDSAHVERLLDFARAWDRAGPMIVHCYAGISRSTAAALAVLCLYNEGREYEAARLLRQRAPHARPNRRIVQLTDRALGLDGRLIDAVDGIGPGNPYDGQARLVELPALLP